MSFTLREIPLTYNHPHLNETTASMIDTMVSPLLNYIDHISGHATAAQARHVSKLGAPMQRLQSSEASALPLDCAQQISKEKSLS